MKEIFKQALDQESKRKENIKKSRIFTFKVTDQEQETIEEGARIAGVSKSLFARALLVKEAEKLIREEK